MPEASSDPELDAIADELYRLRPDDFAAARDEHVRSARAAGNAALARDVAKLRKPTLSAWLINLLWRDQRQVMEQLFELAQELGRAQAEASGPVLRELTAQRRQLESALLHRAEALASDAGAHVTDSVVRETQETLSAALAQPGVAEDVRTGRLVKPAAYSGFGVLPGARLSASARPKAEPRAPIDIQTVQRAREEREKARRRVQEAAAALDAAERALAQHTRAVDAARQREADLRARLDQARDQLKRLEAEVDGVARQATDAEAEREKAERAHSAAREAHARAEQSLAESG